MIRSAAIGPQVFGSYPWASIVPQYWIENIPSRFHAVFMDEWHRITATPRESDPGLLAEILIIFPPADSALANDFIILDELDCADALHHCEPKLRFNAKAERCSVHNQQRLAVHFVGKNRLRVFRQLYANRASGWWGLAWRYQPIVRRAARRNSSRDLASRPRTSRREVSNLRARRR
jgi:hypothetical protein